MNICASYHIGTACQECGSCLTCACHSPNATMGGLYGLHDINCEVVKACATHSTDATVSRRSTRHDMGAVR